MRSSAASKLPCSNRSRSALSGNADVILQPNSSDHHCRTQQDHISFHIPELHPLHAPSPFHCPRKPTPQRKTVRLFTRLSRTPPDARTRLVAPLCSPSALPVCLRRACADIWDPSQVIDVTFNTAPSASRTRAPRGEQVDRSATRSHSATASPSIWQVTSAAAFPATEAC